MSADRLLLLMIGVRRERSGNPLFAIDITANSESSLVRQPLASDGLTASGSPTLWISDADMVAMYRRGTFVSSNALPVVTVTTPTNGQVFAPSAPINMQVTATDTDDSVASVDPFPSICLSTTSQLIDGGPSVTPELPTDAAGPSFGAAPG